jgi:hypothetical protein
MHIKIIMHIKIVLFYSYYNYCLLEYKYGPCISANPDVG